MTTAGDICRIRLAGEFDLASLEKLKKLLAPAESADVVVIDLRDVSFLDSTAIACFVHLRKQMMCRGGAGTIRLENPSNRVRRILELCSLQTLFDLSDSS
jgi:anti-sigma B factor antagonist